MTCSKSSVVTTAAAICCFVGAVVVVFGGAAANAQLSTTFYAATCPDVVNIVRGVLEDAQLNDRRIGALLTRVHFHDCFVNGCDGSIFLDNAEGIDSEKNAIANTAAGGFDVIDNIKTALENVCPGVVSCADILALSTQILVPLEGGPSWEVPLGRRDSRIANRTGAESDIPGPFDGLEEITRKFTVKGLNVTDLVALSGAHTFGRARCATFRRRLNATNPDPTLDPDYLQFLRFICPAGGDPNVVADLDPITPDTFDRHYFTNLVNNRGLLNSDQELFSTRGADTVPIVSQFASSEAAFFDTFGPSMIKMANISPLTGTNGEIRANCRRVNPVSSM